MTGHVGPYELDQVSYDSHGDVLYLHGGERQKAAETTISRLYLPRPST